jgi:hypothetical protein
MAKKKGIRVVLLVEDRMLERFAFAVLNKLGCNSRKIRLIPYPGGTNTKRWVTHKYPEEVKAYRREANNQPNLALLVGTEADELTVQKRCGDLAAALTAKEISPRNLNERIVLWIPKWHVETWILFLSGTNVNENEHYKNRVKYPDLDSVGKEFVRLFRECQKGSVIDALPSLQTAFHETKRLDT